MGKCNIEYKELRFILDPDFTSVFALIDAQGDCPINLGGWRHKLFRVDMTVEDILKNMFSGEDDCFLWDHRAP